MLIETIVNNNEVWGNFDFPGKPKKARHETSKSSITEKAPSNAIKNNKVDKLTDFKEGNK